MKTQSLLPAAVAALIAVLACCCTGEDTAVQPSAPAVPELETTTTAIVLEAHRPDVLALTLYWGQPSDNDGSAAAGDDVDGMLQYSAKDDFTDTADDPDSRGRWYRQFTAGDIMAMCRTAGMATEGTATLYFRLRGMVAGSDTPLYSNTVAVSITFAEAPVPVETPEYVYVPGVTDPWGFDATLRLYDRANRSYAAGVYVDSRWGYQIAMQKGDWDDVYTAVAGGDAAGGKLEYKGKTNIPAPAKGVYVIHASLSHLSYYTVKINKVSCAGMNDDWTLRPMTQSGASPTTYTIELKKTAATPWGVKIVINDDWGVYFGGNGTEGVLAYCHDGFEGDNDYPVGTTLLLTVDLAKCTYKYTVK